MAGARDFISLSDWARFTGALDGNDPRAGEWSALEITRQIIAPSLVALATTESALDSIHPETILVPEAWLKERPQAAQSERIWTWENWQTLVRRPPAITLSGSKLDDYRMHPFDGASSNRSISRLRCLAQILYGLLRKTFAYPTIWNIRGEERAVVEKLRSELEHLRISSATLAIFGSLPQSSKSRNNAVSIVSGLVREQRTK